MFSCEFPTPLLIIRLRIFFAFNLCEAVMFIPSDILRGAGFFFLFFFVYRMIDLG